MTVDLLAATFWPEGTLFGALHPHPHELEGAPAGERPAESPEHPEAADAADAIARAEGFWAAMVRHLWRPSGAPALP